MADSLSPNGKLNWNVLINPTSKQRAFITEFFRKDYTLYGGAAGGGKSYILRWTLLLYLYWLWDVHKLRNVQVGLFCEDYPSLLDRHISKIRFEFPPQLGTLREGTVRNFTLADVYGGGTLALRNLDDPSKYLSSEFAAIAVDELSKNEMQTFEFLRLRCRWPEVEHPKFVAATNPGGIGHVWVKDLWVDRDFSKYPHLGPLADQFGFIQAKASDNPHLPASYWEKLNTLPDHMRRAYADGDWESFAGQFFNIWNAHKQVISRHDIELQPYHTRWVSGDWGFQHPACYHFHAQVGNQTITYAELWGRNIGIDETAELLTQLAGNGSFSAFYLGPDAWAKRDESNPIAHQLGDALAARGGKIPHPMPASNDRIGGAHTMYKKLRDGEWLISDACPKLVQCLPQLIHDDPPKQEDVKKVDWTESQLGDDPYDCARYGLYSRFQPSQSERLKHYRFKPSRPELPLEDRRNELVLEHEIYNGQMLEDINVGILFTRLIVNPQYKGEKGRTRHAIEVVGYDTESERIYLLDVWAQASGYGELVDVMYQIAVRWGQRDVWMDTKAAEYLKFYMDQKNLSVDRPLTVNELPTDYGANAKEKRIEALEPIFKNGQFWCHRSHEPFVNEYKAYPAPATIDCLDTLGYAPRIFEVMRRKELYQWMRTQYTTFQDRKVGASGY